MTIPPYQAANTAKSYDPERARRLLLTKKEIRELADAEGTKGLTIIPLEVYCTHKYVKLRLAIARGKGKADRREDLKKRDALREAARAIK
jgi:SsrA-binding protein